MQTRTGDAVSMQISTMGEIINLVDSNFSLPAKTPFLIKNDGNECVSLEIRLIGMPEGTFIQTKFEVGWNPELIREIKQTSEVATLKYGY
jgi:hypothetical protein